MQHIARPTVGGKAGQQKLSRRSGPRVLSRICRGANSTASRIKKSKRRVAFIFLSKIWDEEGQDQDGINAAIPQCARATKLGSK